jgi:ATP-dependent DNA helicase RecG
MTLIAFKGKDRIHIFDRQDIQDDLLTQFNGALFFLKKHLNRRSEIKGVNREDIYEMPIEALREALANAIIHRDYGMRGTSLMVEIYDDRVEIVNPGGLPAGLEKKDFGKISVRRNERIADLFFRMDKVELAGTGIRRMREAMIAAGLPPPRIRQTTFFNNLL